MSMSFDTARDAQGAGRRMEEEERRAARTELQNRARTNVTVGRAEVMEHCQPTSPVIAEFCYPHVVGGTLPLW